MTDQLRYARALMLSIDALRLKKGARLVGTKSGTEIHQFGKPTLTLTHQAAIEFANQIDELTNDHP